jgi:hypothetical protein
MSHTRGAVSLARHPGGKLWVVLLLSVAFLGGAECTPVLIPVGPLAPVPDPPIDFAHVLDLVTKAADVTDNSTVSADELRARYGAGGVEALVFATVLPGDDGETRFMLLIDPARQRQTIVLGGTNTGLQWQIDAVTNLEYQADLGANVHAGWNLFTFGALNSMLPKLHTDYPITVTGFSLGAALSCIAAEYLLAAGYTVDEVVTFGQPRLTDEAGTHVFGQLPLTRFVNAGDPFPITRNPGGPGMQFGRMIVLYDGPDYAYVPADDPQLQLPTQPFDTFTDADFAFHAEGLYVARVAAKVATAVQVEYQP